MITEIFQFDFMIRAFLAGAAVAVVAPLIGSFLVLRRYSMIADTLAHTALAGIAAGILFGVSPLAGALAVSAAAALGMERLRSGEKIFGESVLVIFLSGSLAVASVLVSLARGFNIGFYNFLFGSIAAVTPLYLYVILTTAAAATALVTVFYKELFLISFDEELARSSGLRVSVLNTLLTLLTALIVSLAMQVVGALLVGALMVIPFITAIQFKRGFRDTVFLAVGISLISVFAGLFLAYYLNLASGGAIVLVALAFFLFSLFV